MAAASSLSLSPPILSKHSLESHHIKRASHLADRSAGFTSPHPNFGCVIAAGANVVGEGFLYAQGTKCAELQAVEAGGELCRGATAFLNLEPGDCHGDETAVSSLIKAGVSRVVVGIRHPLQHLRGKAIRSLRSEGIQVDVLGEDLESNSIQENSYAKGLLNVPIDQYEELKIVCGEDQATGGFARSDVDLSSNIFEETTANQETSEGPLSTNDTSG